MTSCAPLLLDRYIFRPCCLVLRAFACASVLLAVVLCSWVATTTVVFANEDADVRLVIDISGSMKRNDPKDLRQPAVNLLTELLPDGSHAGVWTFGREVNMLVPFGQVNDEWRQIAAQKAKEINSVGLYTNIGGALEKASAPGKKSSSNAHIILLTDGMVDIDRDPAVNQREWRRIVDEIIPELKAQGFSVHTVALSDNADTDLMNKLSLETDGSAAVANHADDLMPAFLKAFDAAAPSQQLPIRGNRFVVDSSVEEFTALMFRDKGSRSVALIGPNDERFTADDLAQDIRWYQTDVYDLVTVERPLEGEWRVDGELAPGSRITVVSDLNLRVKPLPLNVPAGDLLDLQLALQEDRKIVTRKDFLQLLTIEAQSQDKAQPTPAWQHRFDTARPPANGVFATEAGGLNTPGDYVIKVSLDGKSFQRSFSHQLKVHLPFDGKIANLYNDNGQLAYRLTVVKNATNIAVANTQMAVTVKQPDRRQWVKPLTLTEQDQWQFDLVPDQEGMYKLQVNITGVDDFGNDFEYTLDDLSFTYAIGADFDALVTAESAAASASVSAVSSVSSEAASSSSTLASSSIATQSEPAPVEDEGGSLAWLLYAGLGIGNLALVGVGIWAYRRFVGQNNSADDESPPQAPTEAAAPEPEPSEDDDDPSIMVMDELEDEIPPMEDLDAEIDFEEDDLEPAAEPAPEEPAGESSTIDDDYEFDLSALDDSPAGASDSDDETTAEPDVNGLEDEAIEDGGDQDDAFATETNEADDDGPDIAPEDDDMAQAMLKAQGLDLAEDELDDAISHLIDELDDGGDDGSQDKPDKKAASDNGAAGGEINLDDFDFDDEDDDK